MNFYNRFKVHLNYLVFLYCFLVFLFYFKNAASENDDNVIINAENVSIDNINEKVNANGNILIQTNKFISTSDKTTYNQKINEFKSSGNVIIKDNFKNHYYFDELITDKDFNNAIGSNAKIRMNDGSRIVGKSFMRTSGKVNQINKASYTPCLRKNYLLDYCPGWKLSSDKVIHDEEKQTVYYEGAVLSILNVPILYTPIFAHPDPSVKKRTGLLMPSVSNDNNLGTSISIPIFLNIASNYDLTLKPTFQTKSDDYYSLNYRHLTKNHRIDIDSSISNNESNTGTKNHIFLDGKIENPYGEFDYKIRTTNNDTYMRQNQINNLTILDSGLNFTKEMENSYLDFSAYAYKHLNNQPSQKWEYVYPKVTLDIYKYNDPIINKDWEIKNSILNYRDINKNYNQQLSSEFLSRDTKLINNIGLKFENNIQSRFIYFNNSKDNLNQIRIFPQLSSKISYPLARTDKNKTQFLEPVIMPIIAPYNNYSKSEKISSSNIFSSNRETSLSQWEDGPRMNYGINWLINYNNFTINSSIGQSARINKANEIGSFDEISNYFIGNTIDFGNIGYIKTDFTIDRRDIYLKDNNVNASINIGRYKFGLDYDYETSNKVKTSEQVSMGTKVELLNNITIIASARKNLMTQKSIGNAFGMHYENDCIAINLDYFNDFTIVGDLKNSKGFSFTVTLKPFGTSKQRGKTRNFGPEL
tara:strand:+ start:2568 stop:4664 length:2097 start_codon:yes stop_codon:yes gene_type:complete